MEGRTMMFFFGFLAIVFTKWLFGPAAGLIMLAFILTLFFRRDLKRYENELEGLRNEERELAENPVHWDVAIESDEDDMMMS